MTAPALTIQQRSHLVEGRVKTLLNADLKTICRANSLPLTGTKIVLQTRILGLLENIKRSDNHRAFDDLVARVNNHGELPITSAQPVSHSYRAPAAQPWQQAEQSSRLVFRKNPFYDKVQTIVRAHDMPAQPQNRYTASCDIVLTEEQAVMISTRSDQYRIMLYCAAADTYNASPLSIAFPAQVEVKLNNDDVKSNYKGLKGKPGSTKPADLTKYIRARAGYQNKLSITYALTTKKFQYTVLLVRYATTDSLVKRIKAGTIFAKQRVIDDLRRVNADDEIAATSSKMSLKDPISTLRLTTPVRSTFCSHSQCFDASFYMQLQEQAPTWNCPICSRPITFESLSVDKYVEEILQNTSRSIDQVTIDPDGMWHVVKDDAEKGMSNLAKGGARAAYDDDFDDDDDIVEVEDPIKKELDSLPANAFSSPLLSQNTNGQSAASNKRGHAVIDLTLSDEDEPPRPAKRAKTATTAQSSSTWPSAVNGHPERAQAATLAFQQRLAMPSGSNFSDMSRTPNQSGSMQSYHVQVPAPSFGRTSILTNGVNGSALWNDYRSPSVTSAAQQTSPPRWPSNNWQPRDEGGGVRLAPMREPSHEGAVSFNTAQDGLLEDSPSSYRTAADVAPS